MEPPLFEVDTPLGLRVRVLASRWTLIVAVKHPVMAGRQDAIRAALGDPDEVRRSRSDPSVLLFYRRERPRRWLCAVVKRWNGDATLITAYPTDAIKIGAHVWSK